MGLLGKNFENHWFRFYINSKTYKSTDKSGKIKSLKSVANLVFTQKNLNVKSNFLTFLCAQLVHSKI